MSNYNGKKITQEGKWAREESERGDFFVAELTLRRAEALRSIKCNADVKHYPHDTYVHFRDLNSTDTASSGRAKLAAR